MQTGRTIVSNDSNPTSNTSLNTFSFSKVRHKINRLQKEWHFARDHIEDFTSLTKREKEVVKLLAEGLNNPQIAQILFISRSTVEQHRKHINQKLKVKSFVQLMRYAYAFDLV